MRPPARLPMLLIAALACSGSDTAPTDVRPEFAVSCSPVRATINNPTPVTRNANSSNSTTFTVKNNCTVNVPGIDFTSSRTGAVTSVGVPSPAAVNSLAPGASVLVSVSYTVGAPGSGTVVLTGTSDNGAISTGALAVTVTSGGGSGIPFGLGKLNPSTWPTGTVFNEGHLTSKNVQSAVNVLTDAAQRTPKIRMWFSFTGGNEQDFYHNPAAGDSSFDVQKWDSTLRAGALPLNLDGTAHLSDTLAKLSGPTIGVLLGHVLLDDIKNFRPHPGTGAPSPSFDDLEAIAAYSKQLYPGVITAIRARPTDLKAIYNRNNRLYSQVDVGWGQFKLGVGTAADYRDAESAAAKLLSLGLVLGINISDGGSVPLGQQVSLQQLSDWGTDLLAVPSIGTNWACAFHMYDATYTPLNSTEMTNLANLAKSYAASPCKRH